MKQNINQTEKNKILEMSDYFDNYDTSEHFEELKKVVFEVNLNKKDNNPFHNIDEEILSIPKELKKYREDFKLKIIF